MPATLTINQDIYELAFGAAPSGMLVVGRDGIIVVVNAQLARQFGYEAPEMAGMPVDRLLPERYRARHPGMRGAFLSSPSARGMGVGRDLYAIRKDGTEFPVEVGLNPVVLDGEPLVICTIVDITERKRNEAQIRAVIDSAPSGMLMIGKDGTITLVNAQIEQQFGYAREEMVGKPVETLIPSRYRGRHPGMRGTFMHAPSARGMGVGRDLFAVRKDGTEFPVEVGLNPSTLDGEPIIICTVVDITERKRAEEERALLNRQLVETSRRVGMADVATSVLHNVGNVLNSVNTSATTIMHALDGEVTRDLQVVSDVLGAVDLCAPEAADRLAAATRFAGELAREMHRRDGVVRAEIERLTQHVDHVKQVVSSQQRLAKSGGLVEPTRLDDLVEQALSMNHASYERHGIAVERCLAALDPIMIDRHQVLQILANLLVNAKDAIVEGHEGAPRVVTVTLEPIGEPATGARILVRDSGVGIPAENLPKLFAFGFTTRAGGHGFGLHSSAVAARAMGGRLLAESDGAARGATFILELPGGPAAEGA